MVGEIKLAVLSHWLDAEFEVFIESTFSNYKN